MVTNEPVSDMYGHGQRHGRDSLLQGHVSPAYVT